MKKIFYLLVLFLIIGVISDAEAKTIKMVAETQKQFSTKNLTENVSLKIVGDYELSTTQHIPAGLIIKGNVVKIVEPKRGKMGAVAYFKLNSYTMPSGATYTVNNPNAVGKITAYKPLDIKSKSVDLGVSAAGLLVDHISYPINFVRGVATAAEGENKLKAGAELTYEKSMFSYFSKGKHIEVPAGEKLIVTFQYEDKDKK